MNPLEVLEHTTQIITAISVAESNPHREIDEDEKVGLLEKAKMLIVEVARTLDSSSPTASVSADK